MAYSTADNIREATGFTNTTLITTELIERYLADADSVVNAAVADRYVLPLSAGGIATTPEIVETIARFITIGLLYSNEYGEESQDTDKGWKGRLDWAMEQLEKIQLGKLKLYTSAGVEFDRSSLRRPVFSPTDTSSDPDAVDSDAPRITMNMKF